MQTLDQLDEMARETLLDVVEYLFGTNDGRNFMTVGLLVDILCDVIYAEEGAAAALGWQVTGKLLGAGHGCKRCEGSGGVLSEPTQRRGHSTRRRSHEPP